MGFFDFLGQLVWIAFIIGIMWYAWEYLNQHPIGQSVRCADYYDFATNSSRMQECKAVVSYLNGTIKIVNVTE